MIEEPSYEELVAQVMDSFGVSRRQAEAIIAIDRGESRGCDQPLDEFGVPLERE
jgi:hypothetical protein